MTRRGVLVDYTFSSERVEKSHGASNNLLSLRGIVVARRADRVDGTACLRQSVPHTASKLSVVLPTPQTLPMRFNCRLMVSHERSSIQDDYFPCVA